MSTTESLPRHDSYPGLDPAACARLEAFRVAWRALLAQNDIEKLFGIWQSVRSMSGGDENEEHSMLGILVLEAEDAILAAPTVTLRDLHIKIAVCDGDGDLDMSPCQTALAKQAWAALEADRAKVN